MSERVIPCGLVDGGPNGEPLACAYEAGHAGPHSWATLPAVDQAARALVERRWGAALAALREGGPVSLHITPRGDVPNK